MDWTEIELKWQKRWEEAKIYEGNRDPSKPKFFIIFAYPGISGYLHLGHMRSYTYPDAIARYKRMRGFNVLFPAGFHASGLPAVGFAKKVERGDKKWIRYLKENGTPDDIIEKLKDPYFVVEYFSKKYVKDWKRFGYLIDWRRLTSTISPEYNRFIEWQFKKLMDAGLLVQKPHYAPYCPVDGPIAVDPSETDVSKGGNASILEFTVIKFKCGEYILPAATLRPETIFGVTNMWLNPDAEYVVTLVDGEKWILSKEGAKKISYQKENVKITDTVFKGKDLIGKKCTVPITGKEVLILPGPFVKTEVATGVVMSVPGHAPYDWAALMDIKKNPEILAEYGINQEFVVNLSPISIIKTPDFSDFPSDDMMKKLDISSQLDTEKLEEATETVYKKEFHGGVMKENCGEFAGMPVSEAKEKVKEYLMSTGQADKMYEFSEEVICRCGERVVIKTIPDQWFIKYSDPELKAKTYKCIERMTIRPLEYKQSLPKVIEWYDDRACVRQGKWLGTRFPFDKNWIIEPISDSTLYPAFYIVSYYVNEGKVKPDQLTEEFFDYVFLGKGDVKEVSKKTGVSEDILSEIRADFDYWYPLDLNCGGKEHQTVHFPVFIMNHTGIMPEKYWPRGIFVNWWLVGKGGGKLSKSKGGAQSIPNAAETYTVDGLRLYYYHVASPHDDIVWDSDLAMTYKRRINAIWTLANSLLKNASDEESYIDSWIESRLHRVIRDVTNHMENYELRDATNYIYYTFYNDIKWYVHRGGKNRRIVKEIIENMARMMAPFTPHLAEEIWEMLGNSGFVSLAEWPTYNEEKINDAIEAGEEYLKQLIEDIKEIISVARIEKPKTIYIYTAENWKWDLLEIVKKYNGDAKAAIREAMKNETYRKMGKEVTKLIQQFVKDRTFEMAQYQIDEHGFLQISLEFLKKEFNADVKIDSEYDPQKKASRAVPLKPAIYIE